jgi:hypothetical protein
LGLNTKHSCLYFVTSAMLLQLVRVSRAASTVPEARNAPANCAAALVPHTNLDLKLLRFLVCGSAAIFASRASAGVLIAVTTMKAPAACCSTIEAGLRLATSSSSLRQVINIISFLCRFLQCDGGDMLTIAALAQAAESAPRELFALITTMIKALATAATQALGHVDTAAAADADTTAAAAAAAAVPAGMTSCLLPIAVGLLKMCVSVPEKMPLQLRLVLVGRCYLMVGNLITQVLQAPAAPMPIEISPQPAEYGDDQDRYRFTYEAAQRQLHVLFHTCLTSNKTISDGIEQVQLPGVAGAAAAELEEQLQEQLFELLMCVVKYAMPHFPELAAAWAAIQGDTEQEQEEAAGASVRTDGASPSASAAAAAGARVGASAVGPAEMQDLTRQVLSIELGQQLQRMGSALVVQLPQPLWCCNPSCSSLGKLSELALVGGKSCVCSGCRTARFCSKECLHACWKKQLHRGVCKRIAAAAQQ